jgi:hypothetical protein
MLRPFLQFVRKTGGANRMASKKYEEKDYT